MKRRGVLRFCGWCPTGRHDSCHDAADVGLPCNCAEQHHVPDAQLARAMAIYRDPGAFDGPVERVRTRTTTGEA